MFSSTNPTSNHQNIKSIILFIVLNLIISIFIYKSYSTEYFLNLTIQSSQYDQIKLYVDKNHVGHNEKDTLYLPLIGDKKFHQYSFKIPSGEYGPHRLRVFIAGSDKLIINQINITNGQGKTINQYNLKDVTPIFDVKLDYNDPYLTVEKIPEAKDPNILLNTNSITLPIDTQARILYTIQMSLCALFLMLALAYAYSKKKLIERFFASHEQVMNVLFYLVLLLFFTSMWLKQIQPFIEDDGAFFLQYAVNIAQGAFWKYNIQDTAPVWGASAPLWPLVIAFFIKIGFSPIAALHLSSYLCAAFFVLISALALDKKMGKHAAFLIVLFISLDGRLQHYFSSGLESPLTALLISLLLASTLEVITSKLLFAIVIGLLAIQKIDLIPLAGIAYILHVYYKGFDKKVFAIALMLPLVWYVFAWQYFGFPIPNSFLTKALHQNNLPIITKPSWFIDFLFNEGWSLSLYFLLPCALICLFYKNYRFFALAFVSLISIHILAYTIKRPFEPYYWYTIPTVVACLLIITVGISIALNKVKFKSVSFLPILVLTAFFIQERWTGYIEGAHYMSDTASLQDADRAKAGKWVNQHLKEDATVYTGWGLAGYYANRYVYDFSFLNRKYEEADLISKYKPDVLIHQGYISGRKETAQCDNPGLLNAHSDYHIVKTFTSYFNKTGTDYCFFVAIRDKKALLEG